MSDSCINALLWLARAPTGWAMLRSAKGKASRHCRHLLTTPPSTLARHPNRHQWSHWVEEKMRRNLFFLLHSYLKWWLCLCNESSCSFTTESQSAQRFRTASPTSPLLCVVPICAAFVLYQVVFWFCLLLLFDGSCLCRKFPTLFIYFPQMGVTICSSGPQREHGTFPVFNLCMFFF